MCPSRVYSHDVIRGEAGTHLLEDVEGLGSHVRDKHDGWKGGWRRNIESAKHLIPE
jgi:hypothetical protein